MAGVPHFFFFFAKIYLFLGVLGLCCCEQGLFVAVCRLVTGMASFVVEHGL